MRTADFDLEMGVLSYFDSKNTKVSVAVASLASAKKILKTKGVPHEKINVYKMGNFKKSIFL